jgi:hypothetical protein
MGRATASSVVQMNKASIGGRNFHTSQLVTLYRTTKPFLKPVDIGIEEVMAMRNNIWI